MGGKQQSVAEPKHAEDVNAVIKANWGEVYSNRANAKEPGVKTSTLRFPS